MKLRNAKEKSQKEIATAEQSYNDLRAAEAELARKKLGWGFEWTFRVMAVFSRFQRLAS